MYLGIDLGTTNVKAVIVEDAGRIAATSSMSVDCFRGLDGSVEQDIEQIWDAACAAIRQAVHATDAKAIRSIGVSSQGGAIQLLDAEDRPLGRVISWLDTRGRPFDMALSKELGPGVMADQVGHSSSAMTLGQILRIRKESPHMLKSPNRLGFVGDVIVGRLCGRRAHDPTSLGIGMLYNPWRRSADPEILARLGLEDRQLPDLIEPATMAGSLRSEVAARIGLPQGIPVSAAIHDQYAAAVGAGAVEPGNVVFGSGTAWVLLATTPQLTRPVAPQAFVCRHPAPELFGQMIPLGTGGCMIDWIVKLLVQSKASPSLVDSIIQDVPPGSLGLQFWPQLLEDGDDASRNGRLDGLTPKHQSPQIIRAVVEGLACELARHLKILADAGIAPKTLLMCGSAAGSRCTPQIIADVTAVPVACVDLPDVSAFGAAMVARSILSDGDDLVKIARQWSPVCRMAVPGPDRMQYRGLLERYLASYSASLGRNPS